MAGAVTKSSELYSIVKQISDAVFQSGIIMTRHNEIIQQQNAAIVAAISSTSGAGNTSRQYSKPISEHKAIQYL